MEIDFEVLRMGPDFTPSVIGFYSVVTDTLRPGYSLPVSRCYILGEPEKLSKV